MFYNALEFTGNLPACLVEGTASYWLQTYFSVIFFLFPIEKGK